MGKTELDLLIRQLRRIIVCGYGATDSAAERTSMDTNVLEEWVILGISYLVPIVEACGAVVIVLGVIRTLVQYVRGRLQLDVECLASMRLQLVPSLVMGLDFQLAADVLKTAISPTWDHILVLGALIALRTTLNFLLERELHHTVSAMPAPGVEQGSGHQTRRV
jgi:uncharacterized membrane protein